MKDEADETTDGQATNGDSVAKESTATSVLQHQLTNNGKSDQTMDVERNSKSVESNGVSDGSSEFPSSSSSSRDISSRDEAVPMEQDIVATGNTDEERTELKHGGEGVVFSQEDETMSAQKNSNCVKDVVEEVTKSTTVEKPTSTDTENENNLSNGSSEEEEEEEDDDDDDESEEEIIEESEEEIILSEDEEIDDSKLTS